MDSYGQVWLVLKKKQETKKMIMAAFLNIAIFAAVFSSLFPTSTLNICVTIKQEIIEKMKIIMMKISK